MIHIDTDLKNTEIINKLKCVKDKMAFMQELPLNTLKDRNHIVSKQALNGGFLLSDQLVDELESIIKLFYSNR